MAKSGTFFGRGAGEDIRLWAYGGALKGPRRTPAGELKLTLGVGPKAGLRVVFGA